MRISKWMRDAGVDVDTTTAWVANVHNFLHSHHKPLIAFLPSHINQDFNERLRMSSKPYWDPMYLADDNGLEGIRLERGFCGITWRQ